MHIGNRLRGFAIAVAALFAMAPVAVRAQQPSANTPQGNETPVVVVSIAGVERLTNNVNYVASALGQPAAGNMFGMMANTYTNGLDRSRPIGFALLVRDDAPTPVVFIPTADVKRVLRTFEPQTGPADELDDGTLALATGTSMMYIRQQGQWAYGAQSREHLANLPDDPSAWLSGMGEAFDIGVRANVQALTPEQREMMIAQIRQGFEAAMAVQPPEQAEQVRQMGTQTIEQIELVINDTETLQFGFAIEPNEKQLRFEILMTAAPDTELATMFQGQQAIPSKFASVIQPEAAAYFHGAASIGPQGVEQAKASLEQASESVKMAVEGAEDLEPEARVKLERFLQQLIEIGSETIQEGKSDAGGLLSMEGQQMNAVAGFFVSDGAKVAELAKQLAAEVEGEEDAPRFTFDADTYEGITLHYIEGDLPEDKEAAREVFGPTVRLTLGTGPDAVYLAIGQNSQALLEQLIDSADSDTGTDRPLSQGQVRLRPILEFVQSINADETVAAMIDALARAQDTDKVAIVSESIDRGSVTELTIGEGILRAIGAAVSQQQQQQQQNQRLR